MLFDGRDEPWDSSEIVMPALCHIEALENKDVSYRVDLVIQRSVVLQGIILKQFSRKSSVSHTDLTRVKRMSRSWRRCSGL